MESIFIDGTEDTPKIRFDLEAGEFEWRGNSYPENSAKLFEPLLTWFQNFIDQGPHKPIVVIFNFDYFNTSSAKYILEFLRLVEHYKMRGNNTVVKWYYFEDDTDMLEAGEDYMQTIDVEFELIQRSDTL